MKAIKLCLALMSVDTAVGLGTRNVYNPDKLYGKGDEYEARIKNDHALLRGSMGLGAAEEKMFT